MGVLEVARRAKAANGQDGGFHDGETHGGREKYEQIAEIQKREDLSRARWGPSAGDPGPGTEIPADDWKWRAASLPHAEWSAWRARALELAPPGSTAEQVRAANHAAYLEISNTAKDTL